MKFLKNKKNFAKDDFFILLPNLLEIVHVKLNLNIVYDDILFIDSQKKELLINTENFSKELESHNCFLWGARGMGKSSLIKCVINKINNGESEKLKFIEILDSNLKYLPEIIYFLKSFKYKFILFIDDISFDNSNRDFKTFKSLLDGSLLSNSPNIRFYVTSNLRHLISNNKEDTKIDDITKKEIYSNIVSLSDRFGCRLGFFENSKVNYLKIVEHYANKKRILSNQDLVKKALEWSIQKGSFSGRTAFQFILTYGKKQ